MLSGKKRPNIDDIAAAAGVSKTTVSRYLNGHFELMSAATRERIRTVIELTDYRPNEMARNLKLKRTNLIGVVVADMASPFATDLVASLGEAISEAGYQSLFMNSRNSEQAEKEALELLMNKGVEGFLVNTVSCHNPNLISIACKGVPIVLCDRHVNGYSFNAVGFDNYGAIYAAVRHLKQQGYTRVFFFTQDWEDNSTRRMRKEAFVLAMQEIYGYDAVEDIHVGDIYQRNEITGQVERMLSKLRPEDIPAVIGTNSSTTVLIYKALRKFGVRIPDMGLCGPDDWDWEANVNWPAIIKPSITTFTIPTRELGRQAVSLLMEAIRDPDAEPRDIRLPSRLQVRGSTMRIRKTPASG